MRPAVVVLGFILGSAAAITFALGGTTIVFLVLRAEHPRLAGEMAELLRSVSLFAALTAVAAASFYGEIKAVAWRVHALTGLAGVLLVVIGYYALR